MSKRSLGRYISVIGLIVLGGFAGAGFAATPYHPTQPDPVLESWRWRSFPELKGFGLRCMVEAKGGSMWFGVDDGVRRYDGVHWTAFTPEDGLLGAPVNVLMGARDGSVYAGTPDGISRYFEGKWERIFPTGGDLPWPVGAIIEASDGSIWAATEWGALRLRGQRATLFTSEESAATVRGLAPGVDISVVPDAAVPARSWDIAAVPSGTGAVLVPANRYSNAQANRKVVQAVAPGGPAASAGLEVGDRILAAVASGDSVRWTVRREGRNEPFEVRFGTMPADGELRDFNVYEVFEDRDGAMWFGLFSGEMVRWNPKAVDEAAWRLYTEHDGMNVSRLPRIAQTPDGTIWTVSEHSLKGGNWFDGSRWVKFSLLDMAGLNLNTSILVTDDGTLWIGGSGSLHALPGRSGRATPEERLKALRVYNSSEVPAPSHRTRLLEASDGALWVAGLGQEAARMDYATSRWTTYEGLIYADETPDGAQWFLTEDDGVVRRRGETWTRYGAEDGLMDAPYGLFVTREGEVWAVGSHHSNAATARFDGVKWSLKVHPELSWAVYYRAVYQTLDGSLWFGAAIDWNTYGGKFQGGLLKFDGKEWTHYADEVAPGSPYGIGQTEDGALWIGGAVLTRYDGQTWSPVTEPEELATPYSQVIYTGLKGDMWVGHRLYGLFHYDGKTWTRYGMRDGLADNTVQHILQTADGSVWVTTGEGVSRFDGRTWTANVLPEDLRGEMRQASDGALWISPGAFGGKGLLWFRRSMPGNFVPESVSFDFRTTRYEPDRAPPETEITLAVDRISQPGNTTLAWKGADPWRTTPEEALQYSYRMDGGEWSAFTTATSRVFEQVPSGKHTFEVKARDMDLNVDPTPASVVFTVVPPVWQEPWFIAMIVIFVGITSWQATRIVAANRKLTEGNAALSMANRDLFGLNRVFQRDRAVERVRAEVTGMKSPDDLKEMVAEMLKELSEAGVEFDLCVINILDEQAGVRRQYGATKAGWSGQGEEPLENVSEGFLKVYRGGKPVIRQVDDVLAGRVAETRRLLGLEPEDGRPTAIVEVPFQYGTLSLSTRKQDGFAGDDVALVEEFARVMALGYARYLDFQTLEAQNRELQRERSVERIRGEVQEMEQAGDFERVLSVLAEDLKGVGLHFDTCGIDVLGEPVDEPTMAYFEAQEFRYVSYTIDPGGSVTRESYHTPAPFPPVVRETIERFIAGEPWQGRSGQTAIVEVPAAGYGRLRLTASDRPDFTEEEIRTLQEFAEAIALGYARSLDFQRLEAQNRELEAANLEVRKQTERKSAFLASMSHELRTPMNAILGFTGMVLRRAGDILPERQKENLNKVTEAATHLLNLINDLLDLSRIEAGRMDVEAKSFPVKKLVQSCVGAVEPLVHPGVDLKFEVADVVDEANTDEGKLRHVIGNLLGNAVKFTEKGEIAVRAGVETGQLIISVSDTGIGIPEEALETIFDEFQQVKGSAQKHKGTGLGLAISKRYAELLGGTIGVESEEGKGSVFTVRVPVVYRVS